MAAPLLLSVQDAIVSFGGKVPLFDGLSFNIHQGSKIALVGRNGAGKTTLMRMITGEQELDDGTRWQDETISIGYMQQDITPKAGQSVREFIMEGIEAAEKELHEYKVDIVAEPLELTLTDKMDKLSGGQIRRACLARALVESPEILLLDEPTNHLDLAAIEWLEDYIKNYRGTLICISHDKTFLANITDKIFWLDRGRVRVCPKGFGHFDEWSTMLLEQEERELRKRKALVAQEVEWASRGVKARRKRNIQRLENMKAARDKLKNDMSGYNRAVSKVVFAPQKDTPEYSSRILAEFYNVSKSFTDDHDVTKTLLDKFSIRILRGDRIGILGKNGTGKTTFLKMLIGELAPDMGRVKLAKNVELSYFDQKRSDLDPTQSLWKVMCPAGGDYVDVMGKQRHVCGYLKDFMFDPEIVRDKVSTLSGGQKNRLMLARVLANPGNLLILDEPTNDLDMDTLDILEEILSNYQGTLIVVSHDRDFLDQTVSKILAFEGEANVEGHIGGYSDYLAAKRSSEEKGNTLSAGRSDVKNTDTVKPITTDNCQTDKPKKKLSYKDQRELNMLPDKIEKLEAAIAHLHEALSDPEFYPRDPAGFQEKTRKLAEKQDALTTAEERWLELEEMQLGLDN